jgi:hypothetical protein
MKSETVKSKPPMMMSKRLRHTSPRMPMKGSMKAAMIPGRESASPICE